MKLALLSDIHSNIFALQSVLTSVKKKGIEQLLITGDFVGYYFWPREIFELLESWNVIAVKGNHDRMMLKSVEDKQYLEKITKKYGSGLKVAMNEMCDKNIKWLNGLPENFEYKINGKKLLLCHGSPWDGDEYIYPDCKDDIEKKYIDLNVDYVIQGHTHYPMEKKFHGVTVINPGSVGQPRNGQNGAHWAMLDTSKDEIRFYCEPYDREEVIEESRKRHPEIPYLADILER